MPGQISVTDQNGEELNATLVGQSDFSCLPLVPVFLGLPTHVFHAHQSGVNAISLVKSDGKMKERITCGQPCINWSL